jgi:hypothetical protein
MKNSKEQNPTITDRDLARLTNSNNTTSIKQSMLVLLERILFLIVFDRIRYVERRTRSQKRLINRCMSLTKRTRTMKDEERV